MAKDADTTQTVTLGAANGTTTFVQSANVINNYIKTDGSKGATTPSPKADISTETVLPEQQKIANEMERVGDFDLDLWDKELAAIEAKAKRAEQIAANPKAADKPKSKAKEPLIKSYVPNMKTETLPLYSFSISEKEQLARMLDVSDKPSPNFNSNIMKAMETKKIANNGEIDVVALVQHSQSRWAGLEGRKLTSLDVNDRKYIQDMLGVKDDGDVGRATMQAARNAGIVGKNDRINQNELIRDDGKYLAGVVNGNIANIKQSKEVASNTAMSGLGDLVADATKGLEGVKYDNAKVAVVPTNDGQKPQAKQTRSVS